MLFKKVQKPHKASTSPQLVDVVERVGLLEAELQTFKRKFALLSDSIEEESALRKRQLESLRARMKPRADGKFSVAPEDEPIDGAQPASLDNKLLTHQQIYLLAKKQRLI